MKINAINNTYNNVQSFKKTAIPYPEYASAYVFKKEAGIVDTFVSKMAKLFTHEISSESAKIKSQIDNLYSTNIEDPKKALLTVLA